MEILTYGNFGNYNNIDTINTIEIERHQLDFDKDNLIDTLILENLKVLVGDPQIFSIVKINSPNGKQKIIKNIGGYLIDKKSNIQIKNLINSDKILVFKTDSLNSVFAIWDFQYPDCTSEFYMFQITDSIKQLYKGNLKVTLLKLDINLKNILIDGYDCETKLDQIKISIK